MIPPPTFNTLTLLATTTLLLLDHSTPIHAHPQYNPSLPSQSTGRNQQPQQFNVPMAPPCCTAAVQLITDGSVGVSAIQAQIDECYRPGGCAYTAFFSAESSTFGPAPTPTATGTGYAPPLVTGYYHGNGTAGTDGSDTTGSDASGSDTTGSGSGSGPSDGGNAPSGDDGSGTGVTTPSMPFTNGTAIIGGGSGSLNGTSGEVAMPAMNKTDAASGKHKAAEYHEATTGGGAKIQGRFVEN